MVALSFPIKLAQWILSQSNPDLPNFYPFPKSNIPRDRSFPMWFKCGGTG